MPTNMIYLPSRPPIYMNTGQLPFETNAGAEAIVLTSPPGIYIYDGTTWNLAGGGPVTSVTSITGTPHQIIANVSTGAVTLSTPQDIDTTSAVQFGTIGVGGALATSAILSLTSTTLGFLPPVMTTTQKNAIVTPATGLTVYDNTLLELQFYNGTSWVGTTSSGVVSAQGTANQVLINGVTTVQTGALVFTLPQSIGTASAVQFGSLGIGSALVTSSILSLTSTTLGFLPPRMTTTQKNAIATPAAGLVVYDSTLTDLQFYNGSAWVGAGGVTSGQGTANQVLINGATTVQTGALVFTLPQSIATSSAVQFGTLGLGSSIVTSSILSLTSTTLGFLPPRMTTTQKNAIVTPGTGLVVYDSTLNDLQFYNGSAWVGATLSGVTTWQGTANQLTPTTATSGAVTAALANGISIGSYQATTPPAGGLIQPGALGVGTSGPVNTADFAGNMTIGSSYAGVRTAPTDGLRVQGQSVFGFATSPSVTCFVNIGGSLTSGAPIYGLFVNSQLSASSTGSFTAGIGVVAITASSATMAAMYGVYIDSPSNSSAAAITKGVGLVVNPFTQGTNRYGIYCSTPTGGTSNVGIYTDSISVGYASTDVTSGNAIINGLVGIKITSGLQYQLNIDAASSSSGIGLYHTTAIKWSIINAFSDDTFRIGDATAYRFQIAQGGNAAFGVNLTPVSSIGVYFSQTVTSTTEATGLQVSGPLGISSGTGAAEEIYVGGNFSANVGTISIASAINIGAGTGGGTINNGYGILINAIAYGSTRYGIYVNSPGTSTTKFTAFFDPGVGVGISTDNRIALRVNTAGLSNLFYTFYVDGAIASTDTGGTSGGDQIAILNATAFVPAVGARSCYAYYNTCIFATQHLADTITNVFGYNVSNRFTGNVGTVLSAYGVYVDPGGGTVGTVNTHYGLYVNRPAGGTSRYTAYFDAIIGIGGGPLTYAALRINGSSQDTAYYLDGVLNTNAGSLGYLAGQVVTPILKPTANAVCRGIYLTPQVDTTSSAVSTFRALEIVPPDKTGGNTLSTSWSLYVTNPAGATLSYIAQLTGFVTCTDPKSILINPSFAPTSGSSNTYCMALEPVFIGVSGQNMTNCFAFQSNPAYSSYVGNTMSFAYNMWLRAGSTNTGTINESYTLVVETPQYGTNKRCARFDGNTEFFTTGTFAQSYGGGVAVIAIGNRTTAPTSNPVGGGILYAASGAGTWRGSSGTVTTFGPADPHCPICGSDFGFEWDNEKYGGNLRICAVCLSNDLGAKPYIRWNEKSQHLH